jgi:hypothetical protein
MSPLSPTLLTASQPTAPLPLPLDWETTTTPSVSPEEIGPCGLPLDPLDPVTIQAWEAESEVRVLVAPTPAVTGQAELSGFEDDEDLGGGEEVPDVDDEDEFDDFDDIDEDDFDDDFDDDFEEELDDDYEIEIEDEISAEFGLSGVVDVDIDEIEAIDALDVDVDIDIDPVDDDLEDKE